MELVEEGLKIVVKYVENIVFIFVLINKKKFYCETQIRLFQIMKKIIVKRTKIK